MLPGVLALIGRSLRTDSRSRQAHLIRLGLLGLIYLALWLAIWRQSSFGAPGLRFFYGIGYLNLVVMSLLGISYFATSISEEKEEEALGLMMMAGISPLGILVGKSGGRLFQAAVLLILQYPFALLAITMGGVTQDQISAAFVALAAYMMLLFGLGLVCSTIGASNRLAIGWTIVGLSAYVLVPLFAVGTRATLIRIGVAGSGFPSDLILMLVDKVAQVSVFQRMGIILTTGFDESKLSLQVISNFSLGLILCLLAWLLFGSYALRPVTAATSRGMIARSRGRMRWFSPGRAWTNPFIWKDFYFVSGGLGMVATRCLFCVGLAVISLFTDFAINGRLNADISFYQLFLSLAVAIDAGRVLARSVQDEIRERTLSSLLMLPRTSAYVVYSKFAGALLGWLPGLVVDALVSVTTHEGWRNFHWILNNPLGFCVASYFILIPNLAALLALFLRWGAVPLSVAVAVGIHVAIMSMGAMMWSNSSLVSFVTLAVWALCILCHLIIIRWIGRLSAN